MSSYYYEHNFCFKGPIQPFENCNFERIMTWENSHYKMSIENSTLQALHYMISILFKNNTKFSPKITSVSINASNIQKMIIPDVRNIFSGGKIIGVFFFIIFLIFYNKQLLLWQSEKKNRSFYLEQFSSLVVSNAYTFLWNKDYGLNPYLWFKSLILAMKSE